MITKCLYFNNPLQGFHLYLQTDFKWFLILKIKKLLQITSLAFPLIPCIFSWHMCVLAGWARLYFYLAISGTWFEFTIAAYCLLFVARPLGSTAACWVGLVLLDSSAVWDWLRAHNYACWALSRWAMSCATSVDLLPVTELIHGAFHSTPHSHSHSSRSTYRLPHIWLHTHHFSPRPGRYLIVHL